MNNFKDTPIKNIEKAIKSWMAQASQREKKVAEKINST